MFDRWNNRIEELAGDPKPRSSDSRQRYQTRAAGVEKHRPPRREMDDYWEIFKEVSIVREPIRAFSIEIFADGYYIDTENEQAREDLEEWLKESCIVNGDVDLDLRDLGKETVVQKEVKGTAIVEVVRNEDGSIYGFKSIPPDTIKQYTHPGQSVLIGPDDDVDLPEKDYVTTEDGSPAAYVQWDDSLSRFDDREHIPFTRDEILKFVRDGDVGDVWGESRLSSVSDRIESLLNKLDNNDQAIESLAYKFWLLRFGDEDNVWDEDEIQEFMSNHTAEDFAPGMKQGVQGNVDIQTISGEVAEIEEYLDFDINWIISSMPYPKYGLGGFEENVNQFVSRSQETRVENQIRETRKDIEDHFNPIIKDKAEELGYSREDVELVIDTPPEEKIEEWREPGDVPEGETDYSRPPASSEEEDGPEPTRPEMREEETSDSGSVWNAEFSTEQLADPRFATVDTEQARLQNLAEEALLTARDEVLERYRQEYADLARDGAGPSSPKSSYRYRRPAETGVRLAMSRADLFQRASTPFSEALQETYEALEREGLTGDHSFFGYYEKRAVRGFSDNFSAAVRDAAEEMARDMSHTIRSSIERDEGYERARERAEGEFSEGQVRNTARLISHMEVKNAVETTRLEEYRENEDVIGVKPITNCDETTSTLCRRLCGCDSGEPEVALFEDGPIGEQLQNSVSDDALYAGFEPLPEAPPFHWQCSTELAAVTADMEELEED